MQVSNKGHRAVLLSVLCDLLENTKSHPFFMAWKSPRTSVTGAQLLLSVWREEEAARGMTEGGQLSEYTHVQHADCARRVGHKTWHVFESLRIVD